MAFGDPHYKTFDGKIYSFQGIGRYQLVSDCGGGRTFSIRVANMYRNKSSKQATTTKRVSIKAGELRVNLGQDFRIKVNGDKKEVPYKHKSGQLRIDRNKENVIVSLHTGVKVLWNGKSFLEVTVPASYKNKLCGLCGNFNSNVQVKLRLLHNLSSFQIIQRFRTISSYAKAQ